MPGARSHPVFITAMDKVLVDGTNGEPWRLPSETSVRIHRMLTFDIDLFLGCLSRGCLPSSDPVSMLRTPSVLITTMAPSTTHLSGRPPTTCPSDKYRAGTLFLCFCPSTEYAPERRVGFPTSQLTYPRPPRLPRLLPDPGPECRPPPPPNSKRPQSPPGSASTAGARRSAVIKPYRRAADAHSKPYRLPRPLKARLSPIACN